MAGKQKNILIIEPDGTASANLQKGLEKCGHMVTVSTNGSELFDKTKKLAVPDLIITEILDLRPGVDAFRLIRTLKSSAQTRHTKVIVCSEKQSDADISGAKSCGADIFIAKPFVPSEVIGHIEKLMESSSPSKTGGEEPVTDKNPKTWVDFRRKVSRVAADGRRHPRIEFHCPVRIEGLNGVHQVTDMSLGGVFVEFQGTVALKVGETRQLTIKVPTEHDPIKVKAEVANARERGVGFKFLELTGKNQEMIRFCFETFKDTIPLR